MDDDKWVIGGGVKLAAPLLKQTFYSVKIGDKFHNVTGRKRTPNGYVTLCIKDHPYSDVSGYIFEHRIVMEMKLGRYLEQDEIIHHRNETKHDNRIKNLELTNRAEHTVLHHTGSKRPQETKDKLSKWAKKRLSNKKNHPFYKDIDEELTKMYRQGKMPTEISRALGITRKTVYNKIDYLKLRRD